MTGGYCAAVDGALPSLRGSAPQIALATMRASWRFRELLRV